MNNELLVCSYLSSVLRTHAMYGRAMKLLSYFLAVVQQYKLKYRTFEWYTFSELDQVD